MSNHPHPSYIEQLEEILEMYREYVADQCLGQGGTEQLDKNEATHQIKQLIENITNEAFESLRTNLRGEDPDQYRPNDLIALGQVEEAIDATKHNLKSILGGGK